jgi:hypothetical protein
VIGVAAFVAELFLLPGATEEIPSIPRNAGGRRLHPLLQRYAQSQVSRRLPWPIRPQMKPEAP